MKTQGIRISDGEGNALNVTLSDILNEVIDGNSFNWAILFLDGMPNTGQNLISRLMNKFKEVEIVEIK